MAEADVDREFEEFWRELVCRPDGSLDVERVKRELYDYSRLMDRASKVYDHVTGGRITKTTTTAEDVIAEADAETDREVERAIEDWRAEDVESVAGSE